MTSPTFRAAGAALVSLVLTACTGSPGPLGPPPTAPPGGVVMTAGSFAFDRAQLTVPAGRGFPLLFENRDGAPHNVRIYDDGDGQPVFVGEVFAGPAARTYEIPPIPAGRHRFRCDVHPEMSGTVVAGSG